MCGARNKRKNESVFCGLGINVVIPVSQDGQSKLFTPAAPRPSPDGAGESDEIDPGGTGSQATV